MDFRPGDNFSFVKFTTAASGALAAPDALPTGYVVRNGVVDNAVGVTVTLLKLGTYAVSGTLPNSYAANDVVQVIFTPTVASNPLGVVAGEFTIGKVGAAVGAITTEPGETLVQTLLLLRAIMSGNLTPNGSTLTFTRKDGVTTAFTITANNLTGARTGSTVGTLS